MKRYYLATIIICFLILLVYSFVFHFWDRNQDIDVIRVGFLSENDEMTTGTYNFIQSRTILEKEFDDKIELFSRLNVQEDETVEALNELIRNGCRLIFTNTRSQTVKTVAEENPEIQFCQMSSGVPAAVKSGGNYHTFNAKNYQGHYVSGVAAGMKIKELLDNGQITSEQALVGYVASFPTAEIISGYTAFLLGVRSEAPDATMHVKYVNALSNFSQEKNLAKQLINEGCVIIAQNSGTNGPAAACQEASSNHNVFHVGYNESLLNDASALSIVSSRANWDPYVVGCVRAVLSDQPIENVVLGDVHGNDLCAGFDQNWIEMIDLNENLAAEGTAERIKAVINDIVQGKVDIFRGNYTGVNPDNMRIRIDLNEGFIENENSSKPTFYYILRDVITAD